MGRLGQDAIDLFPEPIIRVVMQLGRPVYQLLRPALTALSPHMHDTITYVNAKLHPYQPWEIAIISACTVLLVLLTLSRLLAAWRAVTGGGLRRAAFELLHCLPPVRAKIAAEKVKMRTQLLAKRAGHEGDKLSVLPTKGLSAPLVTERLRGKARRDVQLSEGRSTVSGTVYISGAQHKQLLDEAYTLFATSNPLHADIFPSVRQMEAEVVAMTASMLGGGTRGNTNVCGAMTGGGSESILTAIKASRDYMCSRRGITAPEMIVAKSAHAAYWKAAEYFKIKLHVVPVGPDLRLSGATVRRYLNRNTVVVVASAPGFPHGVVDHIEAIAAVTHRAGVCLHVDCCLGGFVLPFARTLGHSIPPFDFAVTGVTSISCDTHKFGMSHKGTSVVLYSSPDIRQYQYTSITEWTGGLYISPGMAGSRPGALIATAWASMVHLGEDGFLAITKQILEGVAKFKRGLTSIPQLEMLGQPEMSVVAFQAKDPKKFNIYLLNDLMTKRGWQLNALQGPAALHFCFTAMHVNVVDDLLKDLTEASRQLSETPEGSSVEGGDAPMYGMANVSPDRGLLADFLIAYQDVMLLP